MFQLVFDFAQIQRRLGGRSKNDLRGLRNPEFEGNCKWSRTIEARRAPVQCICRRSRHDDLILLKLCPHACQCVCMCMRVCVWMNQRRKRK